MIYVWIRWGEVGQQMDIQKRKSLQIVISLRCSWCKNLYPEQLGDDQTEAMKMAFL